jgi:hypothetical protein
MISRMGEQPKFGPALIVSILRATGRPLTTRQLQEEAQRLAPHCVSSNVVVLNVMRISGTIKGRSTEDGAWLWWVEDREENS